MLTLTASIMYWSLQQPESESESSLNSPDGSPTASADGETGLASTVSKLSMDGAASNNATSPHIENENPSKVENEQSSLENERNDPSDGK